MALVEEAIGWRSISLCTAAVDIPWISADDRAAASGVSQFLPEGDGPAG